MLITGSPGGTQIPGAILRVITGVIDFDLNIGEATMLPRVHKDWPTAGILYERTLSADTIRGLKTIGHKVTPEHTMGSTQSIHIINGVNYGYADLRRPNALPIQIFFDAKSQEILDIFSSGPKVDFENTYIAWCFMFRR